MRWGRSTTCFISSLSSGRRPGAKRVSPFTPNNVRQPRTTMAQSCNDYNVTGNSQAVSTTNKIKVNISIFMWCLVVYFYYPPIFFFIKCFFIFWFCVGCWSIDDLFTIMKLFFPITLLPLIFFQLKVCKNEKKIISLITSLEKFYTRNACYLFFNT